MNNACNGTIALCLNVFGVCLTVQVMPNAGKPLFDASSTYSRDFGSQGSDPMLRATAEPTQQTLAASTRYGMDMATACCLCEVSHAPICCIGLTASSACAAGPPHLLLLLLLIRC